MRRIKPLLSTCLTAKNGVCSTLGGLKWSFPCEFDACVLKKRFYKRTKEKWTQLALLSIIEDRLCWVRDDEYRTFPTKTNLCSWAHSGAMLRALKIQISKVVTKRVQETVFHDLHHILGVLLASLFAHLKPCSCLQGQIWTGKQKRCQQNVKIEVDALPWRLVTRMRTFELGSELRIMYYPRNKRSTLALVKVKNEVEVNVRNRLLVCGMAFLSVSFARTNFCGSMLGHFCWEMFPLKAMTQALMAEHAQEKN